MGGLTPRKAPNPTGKGLKPGSKGRPKGCQNATTKLLKDAILEAASAAGGGGKDGLVNYLTEQARKNPKPFLSLLGKVLPMQMVGADNGPLRAEVIILGADH